jgi:medium-chain acyl-[acyl-carrier-protein] hydrolase
LIGFELARALHARGVSPLHLFVSGKVPPGQPDPNPRIHDLPDAAFIGELRALNGMAPEALESPELLELALPAVRSDFSVLESYEYSSAAPLDCPITAFTGEDDPRTRGASMSGWKQQTSAEFREETFPGDHFFIDSCQPILLRSISRALEKHLRGESKSP